MTTEELLLALKDIQSPAPPVWWQLAPIWWFLIFILMSAVGLLIFLKQRRNRRRLAELARRELNELINQYKAPEDSHRLLMSLASWLKRVALLAYPQARLEALNGEAWLKFLDRCIDDDSFSRGPGKIFGELVYRERAEYNKLEIVQLCRHWMSAISPVLHQRSKI